MGRTEEFAKRKQAKTARKRARADLGAQVNADESQAAKRRRRKGTRRACEGMCYTLPTLENPFNEPELKPKKSWLKQTADGGDEGEGEKPRRRRRKKSAPQDEKEGGNEDSESNGNEPRQLENGNGNGRRDQANGRGLVASRVNGKRMDLEAFDKIFWPRGEEGKAPISGWRDERLKRVKGLRRSGKAVLAEVGLEGDEGKEARGFLFQCWHGLLRGRDLLAVAPPRLLGTAIAGYVTGALPHMASRLPITPGKGPVMLIVVPTRERAAEVRKACKPLRELMGLWTVSIHSEASLDHQAFGLKTMAVTIVVGTPQRLLELSSASLRLSRVTFLVLDGADEIVRLGLDDQVRKISRKVRADRQAVVVASTLPQPVADLARLFLHDPVARAVAKA